MTNSKVLHLLFVILCVCLCGQLQAKEFIPRYSVEEKVKLYSLIDFISIDTFLTYQAAKDLDVPLLAKVLDRTFLASSVEFVRLLQPTNDMEVLSTRRNILDELLKDDAKLYYDLERELKEFSKHYEDQFIHLLDKDHWPDIALSRDVFSGIFKSFFIALSVGDIFRHARADFAQRQNVGFMARLSLLRSVGLEALGGLFIGYSTYQDTDSWQKAFNEVDDFVMQFAKGFESLEKINQIVNSSSLLAKAFPVFNDFKIEATRDRNLAWVFNKLDEKIASAESVWSYWSAKDVTSVYHQIKIHRRYFADALWWVSRVDAYLSVIRWMKERQDAGDNVAFVEFDSSGVKPNYALQGLTAPTIPHAVPNNFNINGHGLITGPHALGKTSSLRAIAYAHIMGQSINVVAAKKAVIVPVANIGTYFNVGDSVGESSFAAEFRHMTELLSVLESSVKSEPQLFLIDEPFAKTTFVVGNNLIERFLTKIIKYSNLGLLMSTHLQSPVEFATIHSDIVQNFQPEIKREQNDYLVTFKIIPGAADWWFKNTNNQTSEYIEWLIKKHVGAYELWADRD
ncbi:MAG: hypothetical protein O2897_03600 [bacterium]|nr:hypothetical protein [bacterium]